MSVVLLPASCGGSGPPDIEATGTIAFIRDSRLWVMGADGSGQRALPTGPHPSSFAWSPDGRTLAFSAADEDTFRDLYAIKADGSGLRRLTRLRADAVDPVWSPDGRTIAVDEYYDGTYAIYVVGANGGQERKVTPGYRFTAPSWSQDGRQIAFTHVDTGAVYVMNRDGSGRRVLASAKRARSIAWSPDGRQIAFVADDGLWTMNADGSGRRMLVSSPADELVWSPDSRTIALTQDDGEDAEIVVLNRDGSGLRNLTDNSDVDDQGPAWSPDGRGIAFMSDRDGNTEIYVMNADGSGQRNVSESPLDDLGPAWSPLRRR